MDCPLLKFCSVAQSEEIFEIILAKICYRKFSQACLWEADRLRSGAWLRGTIRLAGLNNEWQIRSPGMEEHFNWAHARTDISRIRGHLCLRKINNLLGFQPIILWIVNFWVVQLALMTPIGGIPPSFPPIWLHVMHWSTGEWVPMIFGYQWYLGTNGIWEPMVYGD